MPRLKHFDNTNTARAVNFSCYRRLRLLKNEAEIKDVIDAISSIHLKYRFRLLGYVIMPNHVHLIIHPQSENKVGQIIGEVKFRASRKILSRWRVQQNRVLQKLRKPSGHYPFWQARCYDHNCRTPESVEEKINYCHNNPVKAKLVREPGEWKWSSYNCYMGETNVPLIIDGDEFY